MDRQVDVRTRLILLHGYADADIAQQREPEQVEPFRLFTQAQ